MHAVTSNTFPINSSHSPKYFGNFPCDSGNELSMLFIPRSREHDFV